MAPEEICALLRSRFGESFVESAVAGAHPYAQVAPERWPDVARFLRDEPALSLNLLRSISALDLFAENKLAGALREINDTGYLVLPRLLNNINYRVAVPAAAY